MGRSRQTQTWRRNKEFYIWIVRHQEEWVSHWAWLDLLKPQSLAPVTHFLQQDHTYFNKVILNIIQIISFPIILWGLFSFKLPDRVHVWASPIRSRRLWFIGILHPLWLLHSFLLFFWRVLWTLRGGIGWRLLGPNVPISLNLCILSGCGSLCFSLAEGGSFSDDDWVRHWWSLSIEECC